MQTSATVNGINGHITGLNSVSQELLEAELPFIHDGQIPLSELLSRVVQDIYAELMTLADTLPSSSDAARKRMLADFAVKHKKQVVKTFAVVRWAKDWKDVQKSMNITSFLMNQNEQFNDAANAITLVKDSYAAEKLRNHDILTSLDVLTTGTYQRLPTAIKKLIIPPKRLTNEEIERTLSSFDHLIRYRLRMTEIVPVEMKEYSVSSGQVHFRVPNLFSASLSLRGSKDGDPWFLVDVEFDINVGGDDTGVIGFPRAPTNITKQYIVDEADARLAKYITWPESKPPQQGGDQPPEPSSPTTPKLPERAIDAALVRLYNFLQMMSLSYQLEILHYQAQRMRSLGWADYLKVVLSKDRKTLTVTYWIRQPPPRPHPQQLRTKVPLQGGTIVISIEPKPPITKSRSTAKSNNHHPPGRSHKDRILHELGVAMKLQRQSSIGCSDAVEKVPSDEVERLCLIVKWTPDVNALGFVTNPAEWVIPFEISANDLDFQSLLAHAIRLHSEAILRVFRKQLCEGPFRNIFATEDVVLSMDGNIPVLHILLCASEVMVVTIDSRTGRFTLRDMGDLAAVGRGPRFAAATEKINDSPFLVLNAIIGLKYSTIVESAEQKAIALGLQTYRQRNMSRRELAKFGSQAHAHLFIQLHNFPNHYLVLVVGEGDFKHALVSVKAVVENGTASMVIEDIGWLEVARIRGLADIQVSLGSGADDMAEVGIGMKRKIPVENFGGRWKRKAIGLGSGSFKLESDVIRELYAYCCARVSHMRVEQQLKARGIPYTHVLSSTPNSILRTSTSLTRNATDRLESAYSSLANSVPVLCVQSKDILQGLPAAEAAMPNIRILPINWWSERKAQVVTCVKLKYVQPPVGKTAGTGNNGKNHTVIRPSKSVIYDTREAIVSFLSEDVNTCVDEFLSEWARLSTIVVIAREVTQMAKAKQWKDVRLLSFDLQTVEFTYTTGYALSISCINQQENSSNGSYQLRFLRVLSDGSRGPGVSLHDDASSFLRPLLRNGRLAGALAEMVEMLRDTLPMALELEKLIDEGANTRMKVDVFPKSCGWYRVLMGDLRHALDFRLMTQKRVVILDASHSVFIDPKEGEDKKEKERPGAIGVLQPIPNFAEILWEIGQHPHVVDGGMAMIDVGLVCHSDVAGKIGLLIVNKVMTQLQL